MNNIQIEKLKEYFNDVSHQKFNEKGQYVFTDGTNINELRHVILETHKEEYSIEICCKDFCVYIDEDKEFVIIDKDDNIETYFRNMYDVFRHLFDIYCIYSTEKNKGETKQ